VQPPGGTNPLHEHLTSILDTSWCAQPVLLEPPNPVANSASTRAHPLGQPNGWAPDLRRTESFEAPGIQPQAVHGQHTLASVWDHHPIPTAPPPLKLIYSTSAVESQREHDKWPMHSNNDSYFGSPNLAENYQFHHAGQSLAPQGLSSRLNAQHLGQYSLGYSTSDHSSPLFNIGFEFSTETPAFTRSALSEIRRSRYPSWHNQHILPWAADTDHTEIRSGDTLSVSDISQHRTPALFLHPLDELKSKAGGSFEDFVTFPLSPPISLPRSNSFSGDFVGSTSP
jgi:hypothetical protein